MLLSGSTSNERLCKSYICPIRCIRIVYQSFTMRYTSSMHRSWPVPGSCQSTDPKFMAFYTFSNAFDASTLPHTPTFRGCFAPPHSLTHSPSTTFTNTGLIKSMTNSFVVNSTPPLITVRPSLMTVPLQNPLTPSAFQISATASTTPAPLTLCARVLTVSTGCVSSVVTVPAMAPLRKLSPMLGV